MLFPWQGSAGLGAGSGGQKGYGAVPERAKERPRACSNGKLERKHCRRYGVQSALSHGRAASKQPRASRTHEDNSKEPVLKESAHACHNLAAIGFGAGNLSLLLDSEHTRLPLRVLLLVGRPAGMIVHFDAYSSTFAILCPCLCDSNACHIVRPQGRWSQRLRWAVFRSEEE